MLDVVTSVVGAVTATVEGSLTTEVVACVDGVISLADLLSSFCFCFTYLSYIKNTASFISHLFE